MAVCVRGAYARLTSDAANSWVAGARARARVCVCASEQTGGLWGALDAVGVFGTDVAVTGKSFFDLQLKHCALLNTRAKRPDPDPELTRFRHALWKCNHPAGKSSPTGAGLYVRIADLTFDSNSEPVPLSPEEVCRGVELVVRCTERLLGSARAGVPRLFDSVLSFSVLSAFLRFLRSICAFLMGFPQIFVRFTQYFCNICALFVRFTQYFCNICAFSAIILQYLCVVFAFFFCVL